MNQEPQVLAQHEEMLPVEEPPFFDRALLLHPPEVRQEYFEQHCLIEHPRLLEALDAILEAICAPGDHCGRSASPGRSRPWQSSPEPIKSPQKF